MSVTHRTGEVRTALASGARPASAPVFVHDILDSARDRSPDAVSVRDARGAWTYRELADHTVRYAGWLLARGVGPGDRVLVHAASDRRVVALLYACSRIGAALVPLGTGVPAAQRDEIVSDARPRLVLGDETALPPLDGEPSGDEAATPATGPQAGVPADALVPALVVYTSGSTARPKGIVCPHRQVVFAACAIAERLRYRADDVVFCRLPLSFDYGLYQALLAALATAELVLAGPGDDAGLLAALRRRNATVVPLVPSLASLLVKLAARDRRPTRVRLFTNTGEALPPPTIEGLRERFPGAGVQLMFGTSECKRVTIADVDADRLRPGSLGVPLRGTEVEVLDESGARIPAGSAGEIVVSGPHVMAGYWDAPELTARVFRRDPHSGELRLHTGDFGHLDADGHLYFHGRRDHVFKHNGTRTSVTEIEAAALTVPGVTAAAVVPPTGGRGALLYAVVTSGSPAGVLRELHERIDPLKVPALCRVVRELPLGPSGKIDRTALRLLAGGDV
ncbi:AMP-binding protein [Streptomyces sp. NPDC005408]|uniref:class I adenylate-forming enzyme family protein n=1 Tax=Streptomyces sp. NPDC005408 TaxID=3155341 RepID=UPI00339DACE7